MLLDSSPVPQSIANVLFFFAACDWDTRGGHDNSYVSDYIKEWSGTLPIPSKAVNTSLPEFVLGTHITRGEVLLKGPVHTTTLPSKKNPRLLNYRLLTTYPSH